MAAVVHGGGRVVKNVAGYDLPKLFTGSFGTLGMIVEATFKIRPLPDGEALFLVAGAEPRRSALGSWRCAWFTAPLTPVLLEAVNDAAAESLGLGGGARARVIGCAGAVRAPRRAGASPAGSCRVGAAQRVRDERVGALRRALSDFSQPENDEGIVAQDQRAADGTCRVPARGGASRCRAGASSAEIAAHAGSGVGWCQLLGAPNATVLAGDLAAWLRTAARECGAWLVFEALPPALRGCCRAHGATASPPCA